MPWCWRWHQVNTTLPSFVQQFCTCYNSVGVFMVNKLRLCLPTYFSSERNCNGNCSYFRFRICSDNLGVCSYLQSCQISSESDLPSKSASKAREAHKQRKSAYNSLFISVVFVACYLPFLPNTMLYWKNASEISLLVAHFASTFLMYLNSSLNRFIYCIIRDSPKRKKHIKANISHEREHVIRKELKLWVVWTDRLFSVFAKSGQRNLVRKLMDLDS